MVLWIVYMVMNDMVVGGMVVGDIGNSSSSGSSDDSKSSGYSGGDGMNGGDGMVWTVVAVVVMVVVE